MYGYFIFFEIQTRKWQCRKRNKRRQTFIAAERNAFREVKTQRKKKRKRLDQPKLIFSDFQTEF